MIKAHRANSQSGFVVSSEVLLIGVILVCGLITGWAKLRDQSQSEIADSIAAIDAALAGMGPALQPYGQPWITVGVVAPTAVAPITDDSFGPPCSVSETGVSLPCPVTAVVPDGPLTLVHTAAPVISPSEANTY